MTNAVLTFGKFKGSKFCDTPKWYQNWAVKQPGFMKRLTGKKPVYVDAFGQKQLNGWDGYGRKGQAVYDAMFDREMKEQENVEAGREYWDNSVDPEKKFYDGYATYLERDSDNGSDY